MSILNFAFDELPELLPVEQGEYEIVCSNASIHKNENTGKQSIRLDLSIADNPESDDFMDFLSLPHESDSAKVKIKKLKRIRDAAEAFGVDVSELDTDNFIGASARAFLIKESDKVYGEQNSVQKYLS